MMSDWADSTFEWKKISRIQKVVVTALLMVLSVPVAAIASLVLSVGGFVLTVGLLVHLLKDIWLKK